MRITEEKVIAQTHMADEVADAAHRAIDLARTVQLGQIADAVVEERLYPFIERIGGKGLFRSHKGFTPGGVIPAAGYWFVEVVWNGRKLTLRRLIEDLEQDTSNTDPDFVPPRPKEELRELLMEALAIETMLNCSTWGNPLGSWATENMARGVAWRDGQPPGGG